MQVLTSRHNLTITLCSLALSLALAGYVSSCSDELENSADDAGESQAGNDPDPAPRPLACTDDLNQWGYSGNCECSGSAEYNEQTGECENPGGADGDEPVDGDNPGGRAGASDSPCDSHDQCQLAMIDCRLTPVLSSFEQEVVFESCNTDTREPDWQDELSARDAVCRERRCQMVSRQAQPAESTAITKVELEQINDSQLSIRAEAEVTYCSDKPSLHVRIDFDTCELIVETANSPRDECEAATVGTVSFSGSKYHSFSSTDFGCPLAEITLPQAPDALMK